MTSSSFLLVLLHTQPSQQFVFATPVAASSYSPWHHHRQVSAAGLLLGQSAPSL